MKKTIYILPFLLLLLLNNAINAQKKEGFLIKGNIKGVKDTTVFLAHYFGYNQQVIKDTARVDAKGNFEFEGTK
jgi:hypothetical protein